MRSGIFSIFSAHQYNYLRDLVIKMNLHELNSLEIKRRLGAKSVRYQYHNRNRSGGSFAINIRGVNGKDFELSGRYNIEGVLRSMHFGDIGTRLNPMYIDTIDGMYQFIENFIKTGASK